MSLIKNSGMHITCQTLSKGPKNLTKKKIETNSFSWGLQPRNIMHEVNRIPRQCIVKPKSMCPMHSKGNRMTAATKTDLKVRVCMFPMSNWLTKSRCVCFKLSCFNNGYTTLALAQKCLWSSIYQIFTEHWLCAITVKDSMNHEFMNPWIRPEDECWTCSDRCYKC